MPKKVKAKKIQKMLPAATGLAMERAPKPSKETVIIHTTREKKRNASGFLRGGGASAMMVPLLGGVAGGAATVWATSKLNAHPLAVAAGTAGL